MASLNWKEYDSPVARPRSASKPGQIWCVGCTPDAGQRGTVSLLMNLTVSPILIVTMLGVAVPLAKVIVMVWLTGVVLGLGLVVGVTVGDTPLITEVVWLWLMLGEAVGDSVSPGAIAVLFLNTATAAIIPAATIKINSTFFIKIRQVKLEPRGQAA